MKVCFLFRPKERGGHSIENVFGTVVKHIEKYGIKPIVYFSSPSLKKTLADIKKINADIYHITGDIHYLALFLPRGKTVITVHDIGAFKNNPKTIKSYIFVLIWFLLPIWRVKRITVVSQLTKDDLVHYFKIPSKKITIIEDPLSLELKYVFKKIDQKKPRILQIGTGWHKNLSGLIEAVKEIPCKINIIGNPEEKIINKMIEYNIDYSIEKNLTDTEVINRYEICDLVFFASFSEGFGMPIIEAQTVGRPVITSNMSPMKEVAGGGAELVDPASPQDIRRGILKLLNDSIYRNKLIKIGINNSKKYEPENISEQYVKFYQSI